MTASKKASIYLGVFLFACLVFSHFKNQAEKRYNSFCKGLGYQGYKITYKNKISPDKPLTNFYCVNKNGDYIAIRWQDVKI